MSSPSWHLYWALISLLGWAGSLLMVVTLSDQWPSKAIILRNAPSLTCNDSHYLRYVMRGSIFVDQTLHELLELCCGPVHYLQGLASHSRSKGISTSLFLL